MPISMNCPQCDEAYTLADRQAGKKVRCKTCEHVFVVEEPRGKRGGIKAGGSSPRPAVSSKSRRDDDEDDDRDDDRPRRESRQGSSAGKWVLLSFLVLLGLGGIGAGIWLMLREDDSDTKAEKTVSGALEKLKSEDVATRREGMEWLADLEPDEARAKEVLDAMIQATPRDATPEGQELIKKVAEKWKAAFVASLAKNGLGGGPNPLGGGGKPAIPPPPKIPGSDKPVGERTVDVLLAQLNDSGTPGNVRQEVMAELARRKEVKAAGAIAKQLPNFGERAAAVNALRTLGQPAEKEVLNYMHHNDLGCAEAARGLLQEYGTKDEVKLEQTIKDLESSDAGRRGAALDWLAKVPPAGKLPPQAAALAQGLEKMLDDSGQRDKALRALLRWGSKDNVPAVAKLVERPGNFDQVALEFLGKHPDPRGAAALIRHLGSFGHAVEAERALADLGQVAEPEVIKYLNDTDARKRDSARRLLRGYKTKLDNLLAQTAEDLRSSDSKVRKNAVEWLALTPRPAESIQFGAIGQALEAALLLLPRPGPFRNEIAERETAFKALVVWATKDNVPTLIKLLGDPKFTLASPAIESLSRLKDPRAAEILVKRVLHGVESREASDALKAIGPAAEKVVALVLLSPKCPALYRAEGCNILKEIGTSDSLETLKKRSLTDRSPDVKKAAKEAMEAINKRIAPKPPEAKQPDK